MPTPLLRLALAGGLLAVTACGDSSAGEGGFVPGGGDEGKDGGSDSGQDDGLGTTGVGVRDVDVWEFVSPEHPAVVVDYALIHHGRGIADRIGWVYWEPILDREERQVVNIRGPTISSGTDDPSDLTLTAMVPDFRLTGGTTAAAGTKTLLIDITAEDVATSVPGTPVEHNAGRRNELVLAPIRCRDRLDIIGVHQVPDTREFIHVCHHAAGGSRTGGTIEREDGETIALESSDTLLAVGPGGVYLYWTGTSYEIRNFDDTSAIQLDALAGQLGEEIADARPIDQGWALLAGQSLFLLRYADGGLVYAGDYAVPEGATRCRIAQDSAIWCLLEKEKEIVRAWIGSDQMDAGSEVVFELPGGPVAIVTSHARTIYRRNQL